jgi:hypothetical protein
MPGFRPAQNVLASLQQDPHARHVPAWMYVQTAADGTVSFVGASRINQPVHPLRYGSDRTHQLIVGELIVRPHYVVGTDVLRGRGLGGLATQHPDLPHYLTSGELILDPYGRFPGTAP